MNGLRDDNAVIDVPENDETCNYGLDKSLKDRQAWVATLKNRLDMADTISHVGETASSSRNTWEPSIYRIPASIREVDPAAYEPRVLSLGPYHHGKPKLRDMDELKWRYLRRFLRRNQEKDLDDYLTLVESLEPQARGAYSELESPVDSKNFVQMLLLDCCFILEFLLNHEEPREGEEEVEMIMDPIRESAWAVPFVLRDILLLENQLPFFLLECLLKLTIPYHTPSLPQIVLHIFWNLMPGKIWETLTDTDGIIGIRIQHILHLIYCCAIPSAELLSRSSDAPYIPTLHSIPCAKKLSEAGVVFKRKRDCKSFLDITFDQGVMEIPPLHIFGSIDPVFHNLIAFEQCHISNRLPSYISAYAYLMNLVVSTTADAQLLKQEGIIVSMDNDEEIAILFNQFGKNTTLSTDCYLASIFSSVMLHCHKRMSKWKAALNQTVQTYNDPKDINYLNNPWVIISIIAAICVFIFTIMQTVLAFFSYLRPTSSN